ncbi:MAG: hypothetical protein H6702_19015 [Myxococcales bacterium]|nr:hypothetical protein [Myxococcales bacterium]
MAGRKLPWWVVGLSEVASAAGADAFWVLIVFQAGLIGLHRFFWIAAVVGFPLGILWARYWRRLALLSPGEIYEVRATGVAAGGSGPSPSATVRCCRARWCWGTCCAASRR